nr:uncharacterized protein LOC124063869 isoform X2 [Scatophagus argus]
MSQKVFFIKLLLVHYATQSPSETRANCNEDVPLQCPGVDIDSMNFLSVTWYKFNNHKKHGIIRRGKGVEATQHYNFTRPARFGENYSLLLPSVTPEDSGSYECAISANVGGRNMNLKVDLIVDACATQTHLTTTTNPVNTTHSNLHCDKQVENLPVLWSIMGYAAVGLIKIILSLFSIWVIRAVRVRSSRRRQQY